MSKDNETIHLALDGPLPPEEPQGFAPDQMITCDECLRANPPTRMSCLYCSAALALTESSSKLRRPSLRQPEKHEPGFNCIFIPQNRQAFSQLSLEEASRLLKLSNESLECIIDKNVPMPLARTASREESQLVVERLKELGVDSLTLTDQELGLEQKFLIRPRSLQIEEGSFSLNYSGGTNIVSIDWTDLCLIVSGRLVLKSVEVKESKSRGSENELLETSQFSSDEAVFDLYSFSQPHTWRVGANSFDFSCLQDRKTLIAGDNLNRLRELLISKANNIKVDDSFNSLSVVLQPVWPAEQATHSTGWRRERPGKFSIGATTLNSNETQFTRYSRLRRYFLLHGSN